MHYEKITSTVRSVYIVNVGAKCMSTACCRRCIFGEKAQRTAIRSGSFGKKKVCPDESRLLSGPSRSHESDYRRFQVITTMSETSGT